MIIKTFEEKNKYAKELMNKFLEQGGNMHISWNDYFTPTKEDEVDAIIMILEHALHIKRIDTTPWHD